MRQKLGSKKLRFHSRESGIEFIHGVTRGGTDHRVDLWTKDGYRYQKFPDTEYEKVEDILPQIGLKEKGDRGGEARSQGGDESTGKTS